MSLDALPRGSIAVMRPEGGPRSNGNEGAKPMGETPPNPQKGTVEAQEERARKDEKG
jgi:hypothetical protein